VNVFEEQGRELLSCVHALVGFFILPIVVGALHHLLESGSPVKCFRIALPPESKRPSSQGDLASKLASIPAAVPRPKLSPRPACFSLSNNRDLVEAVDNVKPQGFHDSRTWVIRAEFDRQASIDGSITVRPAYVVPRVTTVCCERPSDVLLVDLMTCEC
jgi:hypothetical protein